MSAIATRCVRGMCLGVCVCAFVRRALYVWLAHHFSLSLSLSVRSNLITKNKFFDKPTYETLEASLKALKERCVALAVDQIAMPQIGALVVFRCVCGWVCV